MSAILLKPNDRLDTIHEIFLLKGWCSYSNPIPFGASLHGLLRTTPALIAGDRFCLRRCHPAWYPCGNILL